MRKKKPKNSPSSKPPKSSSSSPSTTPAPPSRSPPPNSAPPLISDVAVLPPPVVDEVSDAHRGSPAVVVAQLTHDVADLNSLPVDRPSEKTVIVDLSTDPSSEHEVAAANHSDTRSAKLPASSPEIMLNVPVSSELNLTETTEVLVTADAKEESLSSQSTNSEDSSPSNFGVKEGEKKTVDGVGNPVEKALPSAMEKDQAVSEETWCDRAKGVKQLSKKGEAFTLPSGEACIKIPNSVIEKNRKSWEPFVLGQFYSDPPSQGTLHNIVNGIWSKHYRDIAVSRMEGFSFLFRIPNAATRHRVIKQKLWQIEGQTMFVDKWEPGVIPSKPELTSAPIWLELRNVPLQFFNEDGLERIAGLVGHPKFLHPATANKTNLEVAKVFTIIDPRKPLPEAVNVQFDSGAISRVLVSSPWMPPVCGLCKEIGHVTRRCPKAPKSCSVCISTDHVTAKCPEVPKKDARRRKTRRSRSRSKQKWVAADTSLSVEKSVAPAQQPLTNNPVSSSSPLRTQAISTDLVIAKSVEMETPLIAKLGNKSDMVVGESSGTAAHASKLIQRSASGVSRSSHSDLQADSSDVDSSDSELEEGEFSKHEPDFQVVHSKKRFSGQKGKRGRGPKIN
ncbi:hypothetical protein Bca4012_057356 [Brassica carinata]